MRKSYRKIALVLLVLAFAVAPVAQASMVAFATPACAAMMSGAEKSSCCGSDCDCSIEKRTTDLSSVIPVSVARFEQSSERFVAPLSIIKIEPVITEKSASESPPTEEPLYQIYSDYRL